MKGVGEARGSMGGRGLTREAVTRRKIVPRVGVLLERMSDGLTVYEKRG